MPGYFPQELGTDNTRFVFFNSLFNITDTRSKEANYMAIRTGKMAQDYLTQQVVKGEKNFDVIDNRINTVISLVRKLADIEYTKEQAYINSMKNKINTSIFNISLPDTPDGNWQEFIFLLNYVRTGSADFFNKVRAERERLSQNRKYIDNLKKDTKLTNKEKERASKGYGRTNQYQITKYLTSLLNDMFGKGRTNKNSYANVIKDYIVKENWTKFLEYKNGSLALKENELSALIFATTQLIFQKILNESDRALTDLFKDANSYEDRMARLEELLEDENNREKMGFNRVKEILNSPTSSKMIATGFSRKLNMEIKGNLSNATKTVRGKNNKKLIGEIVEKHRIKSDSIKKDLLGLLNSSQIVKIREGLEQPDKANWLITESQELINISNNEISIALGDAKIKSDNLFIKIDYDIDENIYSKIEKLVQSKYNVLYEELDKKGNISTENWEQRQKQLIELDNELTALLKEEKNIEDFSNSFIIETSDKIYESFNINMNSFDGGKFGSSLIPQLEKINAIASTGGLSIGDLNWLISACINSNNIAVGGVELKARLESYLSLIGTAILFDDSEQIFSQVTQNMEQAVSLTSINKIHLFYLQGFMYYPLSQILYGICDKMSKVKQEIDSTINRGGGAKMKIKYSGFPKDLSPYENLTLETWEDTGAAAVNATRLELTFLGSFLSLLNSLTTI